MKKHTIYNSRVKKKKNDTPKNQPNKKCARPEENYIKRRETKTNEGCVTSMQCRSCWKDNAFPSQCNINESPHPTVCVCTSACTCNLES